MISIPFGCCGKLSIVAGAWGAPAPRQNDNAFLTYREFVRDRQGVYRAFLDSQVKVARLPPMKRAETVRVALYESRRIVKFRT